MMRGLVEGDEAPETPTERDIAGPGRPGRGDGGSGREAADVTATGVGLSVTAADIVVRDYGSRRGANKAARWPRKSAGDDGLAGR